MPGNIPAQAAAVPHLPTAPSAGSQYGPGPIPEYAPGPIPGPIPGSAPRPTPGSVQAGAQVGSGPKGSVVKPKTAEQGPQDILIQLPEKGKPTKEKKPSGGLFKKKEKIEKPPQEKRGLFGKKNDQIMQGAASQPMYPNTPPVFTPPPPAAPIYPAYGQEVGITQIDLSSERAGPHFRYVGVGKHPAMIVVPMQVGEFFTIGRFDVSVGAKQSSFEFDGQTKAVSRRHAAIERGTVGYSIVDLDSKEDFQRVVDFHYKYSFTDVTKQLTIHTVFTSADFGCNMIGDAQQF